MRCLAGPRREKEPRSIDPRRESSIKRPSVLAAATPRVPQAASGWRRQRGRSLRPLGAEETVQPEHRRHNDHQSGSPVSISRAPVMSPLSICWATCASNPSMRAWFGPMSRAAAIIGTSGSDLASTGAGLGCSTHSFTNCASLWGDASAGRAGSADAPKLWPWF